MEEATFAHNLLPELGGQLFKLRTNGGEEYCGAVIKAAMQQLNWDPSPDTYKAIFIAGNEPFTQGPIDPTQSCRDAIAHGVAPNDATPSSGHLET